MKTSRVVWLVLLVAVFVVGASGQEKQRQGERQQQQPRGEGQREPGPPSVEQRFRGAILKAEERLGRIREEVKKPELSEEEEYLLDTIEPTHKLLLAAGADCILELAAMFCAQ